MLLTSLTTYSEQNIYIIIDILYIISFIVMSHVFIVMQTNTAAAAANMKGSTV